MPKQDPRGANQELEVGAVDGVSVLESHLRQHESNGFRTNGWGSAVQKDTAGVRAAGLAVDGCGWLLAKETSRRCL